MPKQKAVIIEDDHTSAEILRKSLIDSFEVFVGHNATACLQLIKENNPDILLLDVVLPKVSGLQICSEVRNIKKYKDLPIILISSLSSPEDQINAYEAGCDEYIIKPIPRKDVLLTIINNTLENKLLIENVIKESNVYKQVANAALLEAGVIGELHQLSFQMMNMHDKDEVISKTLKYFTSNNLNSIIRIYYGSNYYFYGNTNKIGGLDRLVIENKEVDNRFVDFGIRCLFEFENIKILIKNMPTSNQEKCVRIKDNVLMLCKFVNQRIKLIYNEDFLKHISTSSFNLAEAIAKAITETNTQNYQLLFKLNSKIEKMFDSLLLTEEQELSLKSIFDDAYIESDQIISNQQVVKEKMDELLSQLKTIS